MRKSAILEEAHIHDEPAEAYQRSTGPKLGYSAAMSSYFIAADAIHQVETCSTPVFEELIAASIATAKNPEFCRKELYGLDYRENLDRWYGLNELTRLHATVPLFATMAEAEAVA